MFKFSEAFIRDVIDFYGSTFPVGLLSALEDHHYGRVRTILSFEKDKPSAIVFGTDHRKLRAQALYTWCLSEWTVYKTTPQTVDA